MEIVQDIKDGLITARSVFSVYVEDLNYSVPHDELFNAVRDKIEVSGRTKL